MKSRAPARVHWSTEVITPTVTHDPVLSGSLFSFHKLNEVPKAQTFPPSNG